MATRFAILAGALVVSVVAGVAPGAFASAVPSGNTTLNLGVQAGVQTLGSGVGGTPTSDYVVVSVNSQPAAYVDPFALYRD